jgi:hypothetical protein
VCAVAAPESKLTLPLPPGSSVKKVWAKGLYYAKTHFLKKV